ncbi:MAG TPA: chemotaxis protein CheW [Blastocatellia bacterium]|nr:chemotaxis protein CheW [Blastocatellia bacterium]
MAFGSTNKHRLIRCVVGSETYCLKLDLIRSIERVDRLQRNFGSGDLVGWVPGNDSKTPVFSLASRLNMTKPMLQLEDRIIVVSIEDESWGLLVDQVSDVLEVHNEDIYPLHSVFAGAANYFESIAWMADQFRLCLAVDRLCLEGSRKPIPPPVLPALPRISGASNIAAPKGKGQILMFTPAKSAVPNWVLAVSLTQVMEVLEPLSITRVQGAPDYVLGFVNWRHNPVPVIDLNARLGLGAPAAKTESLSKTDCRLLIARAASTPQLCGFLIQPNSKTQSLPIPHEPLSEDLPIARMWTKGIFELENETLVVPDLDRLIA